MTSRRKLEEEIARTTDPTVRKQLQELLDKRAGRSAERISRVDSAVGEILQQLTPGKTFETAGWIFLYIVVVLSGIMIIWMFIWMFIQG